MALTIKGTLPFGIGSSGLPVSGVSNILSAEQGNEATTNVVAKGTDGSVVAQAVGNLKQSAKVEGYGGTAPTVGSDLTVNGISVTVMTSRVSASNEDFVKYSADAEGYPQLNGVPAITSATTASGTEGTPFSYASAASNTPTSFAAAGLPPGLSINTSTGAITGTPTRDGISYVFLSATNASGTGSATLVITIANA